MERILLQPTRQKGPGVIAYFRRRGGKGGWIRGGHIGDWLENGSEGFEGFECG